YRNLFNFAKGFVILAYLFHALEVVAYSVVQYIYIFSPLFNNLQQVYVTQGLSDSVVGGTAINMLFLNYLMNACYLVTASVLVLTYYIPNLERYLPFMKNREREYRGFVRKKVFFFTVT